MVFQVSLSRSNLGWIFFDRFVLAVTQKNQLPLKDVKKERKQGFFCMLPLLSCWLQIKRHGTDITAVCLKGNLPSHNCREVEHQCGDWAAVRWHQSHRCVGWACIPGCFSVSQCAEVNKRQAPSPRQSEFKNKVKHGRQIPPTRGSTWCHAGLRAPSPLCRCFWRSLPSCGGEMWKTPDMSVWNGDRGQRWQKDCWQTQLKTGCKGCWWRR